VFQPTFSLLSCMTMATLMMLPVPASIPRRDTGFVLTSNRLMTVRDLCPQVKHSISAVRQHGTPLVTSQHLCILAPRRRGSG
jgi:hypothetical protein